MWAFVWEHMSQLGNTMGWKYNGLVSVHEMGQPCSLTEVIRDGLFFHGVLETEVLCF
jgi:hypothetical protein